MTKVHYVVAAYFGQRRIEDFRQTTDRLFFVREQLGSLRRLVHELAKVTLVVNTDITTRGWDEELWKSRGHIWPFEIVFRPNDIGWSYQALISAVDTSYPYTIFTEDDYIFTEDHFDRFLVDQMEVNPDVSLICAAARGEPMNPEINHAAVSVGIMRSESLVGLNAVNPGLIPQLLWSRQMGQKGTITDWLHHYATAYWHDYPNVVRWFERPRGTELGRYEEPDPITMEPTEWRQALIVPVQAMDREVSIMHWTEFNGWQRRHGRIDRRGKLT